MTRTRSVELYLEKMPAKAKPIRHLAKLFKKDPSNVRNAMNNLLALGLVEKAEICVPGRNWASQTVGWRITEKGAEVVRTSDQYRS